MQPHYTEQDTERARNAERAMAAPPAQAWTQQSAFPTRLERNNRLAIGLIALGGVLLLSRLTGDFEEFTAGLILFTIASCFLFFAFAKRVFGLFIPGSILAGLALGVPFADLTNGMSVVWGLSLGFTSIAFFGQSLFRVRSSWAMIPAVILFGVGLIILFSSLPSFLGMTMVWVPLLLIGAGLYLGWGRRNK